MMSDQDIERLAHPEFWDERYATAEDSAPTHEWFRTFAELLPFLEPKLFDARPPATNPKILHLGSGDSVRFPSPSMPHSPIVQFVTQGTCQSGNGS